MPHFVHIMKENHDRKWKRGNVETEAVTPKSTESRCGYFLNYPCSLSEVHWDPTLFISAFVEYAVGYLCPNS